MHRMLHRHPSLVLASALVPLFGAALVAGCQIGGGGSEHESFKSGSRLRAVLHVGAEDARSFLGWHDAQLDEDCQAILTEDGKTRCVPGWSMGLGYSDAGCQDLVAIRPYACSKPSKYALGMSEAAAVACYDQAGYSVYKVGASKGAAAKTYLPTSDGSCAESDVFEQFEVTPEPATSFVEMTLTDEPHGDSVAPRVLIGADGSRQATGSAWDPARDEECFPASTAGPAETRCLPTHTAWADGDYFSDASCTTALGTTRDSPPCPAPELVLKHSTDEATYRDIEAVYEVGAEIPVADVHATSGKQCISVTPIGDMKFWSAGKEVDRSTFGALTVESYGAHRLQVRVLVSDGLPLRMSDEFYDTERQTVCWPLQLSDGVTRCVDAPVAMDGTTFSTFADPACAMPLVHLGPNDLYPTPATVVATMDLASCDPVFTGVYVIGGEHKDKLYSKQSGACAELAYPYGSGFYYVGDAISLDTFAKVTRTIE